MKPPASFRCWDCGAENDPGASECWLCHRRNWQPVSAGDRPRSRSAKEIHHETLDSASRWIASVALILVLLGAFIIAPGLVIVAAVLIGPPYLAGVVTKRRAGRPGKPMSVLGKIVSVLGLSIVFFLLMSIILFITLFIAFWLICLATGPPSFH